MPSPAISPDDVAALTPTIAGVVVPKLESARQVAVTIGWLAERGLGHLGIIAGIETVLGVARADEILAVQGSLRCYFGAEDFIADMGGVRTES